MAYSSDMGGTFEVYVQPFPATSARLQISRGGGRQPLWSPDGKRLYAQDTTTPVTIVLNWESLVQAAPR